jgi:hypothetical protein
MALVLADRVLETTAVTGTGNAALGGAQANYQTFSVIGDGSTTYYTIVDNTNNEWEVGIGTYVSAGNYISRDTVLSSSNAGALVYFGSGTKDIFCDLPAEKVATLGALSYQGTWNASTNVPTLASGVGTQGYYYVVSVAGSTNLDGITDWKVNDYAIYNGTAWQKIDNTDAVTSVNGQTGVVVLTASDVGAQPAGTYVTSVGATSPVTSSGGTSPTIAMPAATTSVSGYLTSTDWNTFNGKAPATSGTSILYGNGTGGFSNVTVGSGLSFTGGTLSSSGGSGTVTSVGGTGTVSGISLSGTVTSSGNLTLGGSLDLSAPPAIGGTTRNSAAFTTELIGPSASANFTRFPNALAVISDTDSSIQQNESLYIGTMSEAVSVGTTWASGVYGAGYTNATGSGRGTGVTGEGHVGAAGDTGVCVGVRGYAKDVHTGNYNIGLYGDAENGDTGLTYGGNVALFLANGNIVTSSAADKSWYLGGNITFDGQGTAKTIGVTNGAVFALGTPTSGTLTNCTGLPNAGLVNSSITINGTPVSLGGSASVGTVTSVTGTAPVVSSGGATPAISMAAANTSTNGYLTSTDWNTFNGKGSGTVTSASVVSANGFAGTVATATTTPAITISTSITGIVKGNGTAISAATAGTDYVAPGGALGTPSSGTLTNCTFPTLNQNTTGSAATFTSTSQNSQFNSIGVGTAGSGTAGEIRATNNVTAYYSDDRFKTNLGNITKALDKVQSLNGFYYEANELAQSYGYEKKLEVGVSAQQVQAVMPEVVAPAPIDENYLTVRYERLVPLLIEAIKELKAEVDSLKGK